jgi:type I restriction enzyme S subunit
LARIACRYDAIVPEYLLHAFGSQFVQSELQDRVNGSALKEIPILSLREVQVPVPPLPEQRAIAAALSDVDALLDSLERLIAKQRDLKQAAMQQLLTGQTRLPGFAGEREVKSLGRIAHIKTGNRNNEDKSEDGEYPFFVRSDSVERINSFSYDCEAILIPGEGRIGDIFHYIDGRFDVHQRVYAITHFQPEVSAKFIYFYMVMFFGDWAMQNTVKATVDSLRLPTFQTFEMNIPPTVEEQTAIASVLSDMDAEIAALERRRAKTRDLKQAMMQELLTGQTRLVPPGESHA